VTAVNRREFIKLAGATAACMCAGLGIGGCTGKATSDTPFAPGGSYRVADGTVTVALSQVEALASVGGAVKLALYAGGSERKIIIVHSADEEYRAFADSCTHNGKELNHQHEEGKLACCGRSPQFDLEGSVLRGPAEIALLRYSLRQVGDELVIQV
jgi:nitrite reductase/ring-hydroxylating ferredoxin subunit